MSYRGRQSASIENDQIRVTVLREGGHIAGILHKASGVNPLWTPPWPSIEPSGFPTAGAAVDARLLAGIMGHNVCLDIFGGPSGEEAAAGLGVHGEGPVVPYGIETAGSRLAMKATLPLAQTLFERTIELRGSTLEIRESLTSLAAFDRPIGWTQHVTLGPPFLERGVTEFQLSATRAKTFETAFGADDYLQPNMEFVPAAHVFTNAAKSSAFTTHLMDPSSEQAYFTARHPGLGLEFGYRWRRADFPWLGIWEENHSRPAPPWNGETLARGMEFGVSPFPETRRQMVDRGTLFGVPTYRWLPAGGRLEAQYSAFVRAS
jgi:hypothetical protein